MTWISDDELVCPYCGHKHNSSWDFGLDCCPKVVMCSRCGKEFEAYVEVDPTYYSRRTEEGLP